MTKSIVFSKAALKAGVFLLVVGTVLPAYASLFDAIFSGGPRRARPQAAAQAPVEPVRSGPKSPTKQLAKNNNGLQNISMKVPEALPPLYFGKELCKDTERFNCFKVSKGETWESLFPDEAQRDLVQRINRTYNHLWYGKELVVPRDLAHATLLDYAPFSHKIDTQNEKLILVDQDKLAWGAFNEQGELVKWGPISSGRDKCSDSSKVCRTLTGIYRVFSKENEKCVSDVFPIGKGGAKMPFCMFFHKGFALHGSDDIPGYRASHGCIRMFVGDAKWLNHDFVDAASEKNSYLGTKVIVRPLAQREKI